MCSSVSMPVSGLNLGSHFSGWGGIWLRGGGIKTAPGLFHVAWAILELLVIASVGDDPWGFEGADNMISDDWGRGVVEGGWVIWNGDVGSWLRGEGVEMDDVDERVSPSECSDVFLALFLAGRGSSVGWMPNFPLFNLVRGWAGLYCKVTLLWDLSDPIEKIENPWSLWIRVWTSGGSMVGWYEILGYVAAVIIRPTWDSEFKFFWGSRRSWWGWFTLRMVFRFWFRCHS